MKEGKLLKKELKRTELYRKTLGLLGIGRIGTEVAKRARGVRHEGRRATTRTSTSTPIAEMKPTLDDAARRADYISLHMPLTDETDGMINADADREDEEGRHPRQHRPRQVRRRGATSARRSRAARSAGYATDVWASDPPPPE